MFGESRNKGAELPSEASGGPTETEGFGSNMEIDDLQSTHDDLLSQGYRKKQCSVHLCDYVTHTTQKLSPSARFTTTQHLPGMPLAHYVSCD